MDNIKAILREGALQRMSAHTFGAPVEVSNVESNYHRKVHGNWMSLILISGTSLRITLRVHFNLKDIRSILKQTLDIEDAADRQSLDFVKEFCNLTAGFIKQVLEDNNLEGGISLPIVTRGFDELFYTPIDQQEISDLWTISIGGVTLYCTPSYNIYDKQAIAALELSEPEDDDDDIDFF